MRIAVGCLFVHPLLQCACEMPIEASEAGNCLLASDEDVFIFLLVKYETASTDARTADGRSASTGGDKRQAEGWFRGSIGHDGVPSYGRDGCHSLVVEANDAQGAVRIIPVACLLDGRDRQRPSSSSTTGLLWTPDGRKAPWTDGQWLSCPWVGQSLLLVL